MNIDPALFIYALVFLGALLAFEGVRQLFFDQKDPREVASRRMRMYRSGASPEEVLKQLRRAPDRSGLRLPFFKNLDSLMGKAGLTIRPATFFLLSAAGALLLSLVVAIFVGPAIAAAIGALSGILVPKMVVNHVATKRGERLVAQLPDALDKMARGLRVGHPLNVSISNVAAEAADPLGTEFGIVVDQIAYGDDLVSSIREMADRINLEDVDFFAVTVAIQHGTGGNLARILTTLAKVIRDRAIMRRRIKAISSEGRMTMRFMTIMPPAVGLVMSLTSPSFYGDVMGDPLFIPMLGFIMLMTVLNYLALRKLVNFRF